MALALLGAGGTSAVSAQSDGWQAHTPMRQVRDLSPAPGAVWAATTGGVFRVDLASEEIRRFTTVDGLADVNARAVAYDEDRDVVWVGYASGILDRIDADGRVRAFRDIARADQFLSRGVNGFIVQGDSLFVMTDFGLVVFDPVLLEVRDAYTQFGDIEAATPVRDARVMADGRLWVATDLGAAHASLSAFNLREPAEWTHESGIPVEATTALAVFDGQIVVGTATDAYVGNVDGPWAPANLSGNVIHDLLGLPDRLLALESFSLVSLGTDGRRRRFFLSAPGPTGQEVQFSQPREIVHTGDDAFWVGDAEEGLYGVPPFPETGDRIADGRSIVPEGPFQGLFTDIVFDDRGGLWAAGAGGNGTGFHHYFDGAWTDYTSRFFSELEGRASYDFIHVDDAGNVWAGSQGNALAQVTPEGALVIFDQGNSSLREAPGTEGYVRVRGMTSDSDGTLFVLNQFSPFPINLRLPDGTWRPIPPLRAAGLPASTSYDRIFVDASGQKWILPLRSTGLIVWDTGGTPDDSGDDRVRYLRGRGAGGEGLPDENVRAWAEDLNGEVWIGTERGLAYYFAPGLVFSDDPSAFLPRWPSTLDNTAWLLRDLFVNDIAVDPANQKWIASNNGAWLISNDAGGGEVLEHFTVQNSPLLSDNVVAIAVDPVTGRVFFATDKGLVSWQGAATAPSAEVEPLFVFPNPVRAEHRSVLIDGLVAQTDIRILTLSGQVVADLQARGGRVRWDLRDLDGTPVPSGVYIVAAIGRNGEGTAYGKVAVVR